MKYSIVLGEKQLMQDADRKHSVRHSELCLSVVKIGLVPIGGGGGGGGGGEFGFRGLLGTGGVAFRCQFRATPPPMLSWRPFEAKALPMAFGWVWGFLRPFGAASLS